MSLASPSFPSTKLKLKLSPTSSSSSSSHPWKPPNRQRHIVITNSNADGPLRRPAAPSLSPPPKPTPPSLTPSPKPTLPSLSGPPSLAPPPKPTAQPPTPAPAPAPVQAKVVGTDLKGVVTLEYQRKIAKELQDYFKEKKLEEADQGPAFGFTAKNEISNGRWAMFGFAVGLLTEYATGSDFVQQMKILLSNFGIVDLE